MQHRYNSTQSTASEPLRILFCGSDEFSITSLQAVHKYAQKAGSKIASIDVATKTDKRVGRGLTTFRSPPIKDEALKLNLPLHQFDTFRGWSLPTDRNINMVLAVSFGLLVPPRILTACQYGGLNVHPSMLPDLKGSAPVEYAIIHGYKQTGVTVQTLHPSKFDEGSIVLQTPYPGIDIPDPDRITTAELKGQLASIGAEMLVRVLDEGIYLNPSPPEVSSRELNFAPKLHKNDGKMNFAMLDSSQVLAYSRALDSLWIAVDDNVNGGTRLVFPAIESPQLAWTDMISELHHDLLSFSPGSAFVLSSKKQGKTGPDSPLFIKTSCSKILAIKELTVSGQRMGSVVSEKALRAAKLLEKASLEIGDRELRLLKQTKV